MGIGTVERQCEVWVRLTYVKDVTRAPGRNPRSSGVSIELRAGQSRTRVSCAAQVVPTFGWFMFLLSDVVPNLFFLQK